MCCNGFNRIWCFSVVDWFIKFPAALESTSSKTKKFSLGALFGLFRTDWVESNLSFYLLGQASQWKQSVYCICYSVQCRCQWHSSVFPPLPAGFCSCCTCITLIHIVFQLHQKSFLHAHFFCYIHDDKIFWQDNKLETKIIFNTSSHNNKSW